MLELICSKLIILVSLSNLLYLYILYNLIHFPFIFSTAKKDKENKKEITSEEILANENIISTMTSPQKIVILLPFLKYQLLIKNHWFDIRLIFYWLYMLISKVENHETLKTWKNKVYKPKYNTQGSKHYKSHNITKANLQCSFLQQFY